MIVFKEEILQNSEQAQSLAKWKLVVTASATAAGLGLGDLSPGKDAGVLILFCGGFLAAYADVLVFRRLAVIHTIARYLRGYAGSDPETRELREYEHAMSAVRADGRFGLSERWSHVGSSLVIAVGMPVLADVRYDLEPSRLVILPILGVGVVLAVFSVYERTRRALLAEA